MRDRPSDDSYSEQETARRRDEVIRRMANTPPKPQKEMKIGKCKPIPYKKSNESKTRPASKGRVHKGKTHS
jgi:hypothetical protein